MVELYNQNCFELLPKLESNSIDAIICDPPYNISFESNDWDKDFNIFQAIDECVRILKPNGNLILFQGWSNVCTTKCYLDQECPGLICQDWIIWDRIKGRGASKHLISTREDILWYSKGSDYIFNKLPSKIKKITDGLGLKNGCEFRMLSNVWTDISPIVPWSSEHNQHPTQKPIELLERCILLWTKEKDTVLDFTMGSGTTGVAAIKCNRNFIGVEINTEYYRTAEQRINESKQLYKHPIKFIKLR